MKIKLFSFVIFVITAILFAVCLNTANAVDLTYPGAPLRNPYDSFASESQDMKDSVNMPNSLFPNPTLTEDNSVTVKGNVGGHVYGAITKNGLVRNNTVNINSGQIGATTPAGSGNVTGGWIWEGVVQDNNVIIGDGYGSDVIIRNIVFGGWAQGGTSSVENNSVTINSDATMRSNIYGGYNQGGDREVRANRVTINGGTMTLGAVDIIAGGYSALNENLVRDNEVVINGGTITNAAIYGGRGQRASELIYNRVYIRNGIITNTTDAIWGGQGINSTATIIDGIVEITGGTINSTIYGAGTTNSGSGADVTNNTVTITGGATVGKTTAKDVYGGYSNSGSATNNTVTIGIDNSHGAFASVIGGDVRTGGGDAFSGNKLYKNNNASITTVRNFEQVNFGYTGDANIGTLYTTATGSALAGVTVTNAQNILFGGNIIGSGSLTKTGTGTLAVEGEINIAKAINVNADTLQIGNGGANGTITNATQVDIASGAVLAYDRTSGGTETTQITGAGKVVQRGTDSFGLTNTDNDFTGGTEIESGVLVLYDNSSYNTATNSSSPTSSTQGFFTFTEGEDSNTVRGIVLDKSGTLPNEYELYNTFRTAGGAGMNNYVDLTSVGDLRIQGVDLVAADNGGAFYVADGTEMTVAVNGLTMTNNQAGGGKNDIYVDGNGTMNFLIGNRMTVGSGVNGTGTLNIFASDANLNGALFDFATTAASTPTYTMGNTHVHGGEYQTTILDISRNDPVNDTRVVLAHTPSTGSFSIDGSSPEYKSAMLTGDGIVKANTITVTDAMLAPTNFMDAEPDSDPSTLTLEGNSVSLNNFVLFSQIGYDGLGQNVLGNDPVTGTPTSNNDLLYINTSGGTNSQVTINGDNTNNAIFLRTVPGGQFTSNKDYLLVKSTAGFVDGNGTIDDITTKIQDKIAVYLDGVDLASVVSTDGPRGTYSLNLGADPTSIGGNMPTTDENNIWLHHELNSLTMDWVSGNDDEVPIEFRSLQKDAGGIQARVFLSGDKVHVSGNGYIPIELNANISGSSIVTSGLVVGKSSGGQEENGDVTLSGDSGILTDSTAAFGRYVNSGDSEDLAETGKLEKFGDGILTFKNFGGNRFMEGIDLYNGTLAFDRAEQLNTLQADNTTYADLTFKANEVSTLQPNESVILNAPIVVETGATATFLVDDNNPTTDLETSSRGLFLTGTVDGTGDIMKTGDGVLQFAGNTQAIGDTTVNGGKFRIVAGTTYDSTGTFRVGPNGVGTKAELSGGGTVRAGNFVINGQIASDTYEMKPGDMVVTGNDRYATLTLEGVNPGTSTTTLDGFTFDYRVSNDPSGQKDLLKIENMSSVNLVGGTINIMTDGFNLARGEYLIIDSNVTLDTDSAPYDGILDPDGVIKAVLNDEPLVAGTPRGHFNFELRSVENTNDDLYLVVQNNTLETTWKAGNNGDSGANTWNWSNSGWYSTQELNTVHGDHFFDGDKVIFDDSATQNYTINVDRAINVSGMEVDTGNKITFTGANGIFAQSKAEGNSYIVGEYADDTVDDQNFVTTGTLVKKGSGTLTFENTNVAGNTFDEGIEIAAGTVAFHNADQIQVGTGNAITFTSNASDNGTLEALETLTLNRTVDIDTNRTGAFRADGDVTLTYTGAMTGDDTTALRKTGYGVVVLGDSATNSTFAGRLSAEEGYLKVVGSYEYTAGTEVLAGATLLGTGTIAGPTVIKEGGYLMPSNMTADSVLGIPDTDSLTINGTLTFDPGSVFWVNIAQSNAEGEPYDVMDENGKPMLDESGNQVTSHKRKSYADLVTVTGAVNIDPNAYLNVEIDYFDYWGSQQFQEDYNAETSGHFTIIDGANGSAVDPNAQFILEHADLPLGVIMMQGWIGNDYQLWFEVQADGGGGYGDICFRHNRVSIGEVLDWYVAQGNAPQNIQDIIAALGTDPAVVCEGLDQIHGDLTSNAMFLAMKEPWRHPFNRLSLDKALANCAVASCDPCAPLGSGKYNRYKRQMWGEFTARYEDTGYDNNAHGFTVNRYGVAVGVDQQISRNAAIGANFQYSDPILRQATGRVDVNDYEFGLYGLTRLTPAVEMKAYLGYAHQNYDFDRYVSFGTGATAINEQLFGETSGDSLSASVEFVRPIRWNRNVRLLPVMALDYEKAWMDGYRESARESAGVTSLVYDDASLERLMFRVGLGGDWKRDNLTLNSRLQYAVQLNDSDMPRMGVRFANGGLNQPTADIWGSRIGSDYINWGLGLNWQLSPSRLVYVNYDAKWYDRSTLHIGEAGVQTRW